MKKKAPLISGVAPQTNEEISLPVVVPLTHAERAELREILALPLMRKVWANAKCQFPTPFISKNELNSATGHISSNNRLHEMRGWEMFATAILMQTFDPKPPQIKPQDNYPDAGLPESDFIKPA